MELTFICPKCEKVGRVPALEQARAATCGHCGAVHPIHEEAIAEGRLEGCPWCRTAELYVQKDFPQAIGLAVVIVQFAVATVFWYYERPLWTYAILLGSALLDWALYPHVPDVTICYRCSSQVRGEGSNPDGRLRPFDLGIGERYRQERIRARELRDRGASVD
jgi:hypothetical protein